MSQVILNTTHTNGRLTVLQKTLCELDKEIKNIHDLISRSESEISKCNLLIENKQGVIRQYNQKLEALLSQQGVRMFDFDPDLILFFVLAADVLDKCNCVSVALLKLPGIIMVIQKQLVNVTASICQSVLNACKEELKVGNCCARRVCLVQNSAQSCLYLKKMMNDINALGVNKVTV